MNRLVLSLKFAIAAAALFGAAALIAPAPGHAATVDIPFNPNLADYTLVGTVTGTAGGTLGFTLTISNENVFGSFALDAFANPGSPTGTYLGGVDLLGMPLLDGPTAALGSADGTTLPGGLASVTTWTLSVLNSDYPIYLYARTDLTDFSGTGFTALLSVNVPDDIIVTPTETPLPAALPLFATGLGVLGFAAHRRRKRAV